ncbi:MAG TPA: lysylphosphatidylglycerol synthase domain-containing protein [Mycobacteriales bacterium]|nr:lysylphosphatidylglycerol synthase domain-containing protein [Mycobacteriales bacterium]
MSTTPRTRRLVRIAAGAVFVGFLAAAVASQRDEIGDAADALSPATIALSGLPVLVGLYCSMQSWRAVLADLGSTLPRRTALRIFFLGQLGKYVPGSVWPVLAQMELGRDHKVPRARTAAAGVVAVALGLTAALLVAALTLPFLGEGGRYLAALVVLPVALFFLHPRVLTPLINRGLRLIRRQQLDRALTLGGISRGVAWAAATWLCNGVHVWVVARDLGATGSTGRLLALSIGSFAVSWAAGFLVFVAPAGAGAREAALVVTMGSVLPTGAATLLALVSRAVLTLADIAWAAVAVAGSRRTMAALRADAATANSSAESTDST